MNKASLFFQCKAVTIYKDCFHIFKPYLIDNFSTVVFSYVEHWLSFLCCVLQKAMQRYVVALIRI